MDNNDDDNKTKPSFFQRIKNGIRIRFYNLIFTIIVIPFLGFCFIMISIVLIWNIIAGNGSIVNLKEIKFGPRISTDHDTKDNITTITSTIRDNDIKIENPPTVTTTSNTNNNITIITTTITNNDTDKKE